MRWLLDTNIISQATKPLPAPALMAWLGQQPDSALFISALTLAEIWRGILQQPHGKRRDALQDWFCGASGPQALFAGRILPFDEEAALVWARLMAAGTLRGRPRSALDTMIAAVALTNGCIVVTDNQKDFADVETCNPLRMDA